MSFSISFNNRYIVTEPFFLPKVELFEEWREQFLQSNDLSGLNVMFMGNAAENFYGNSTVKTRDIDIMISGDVECSRLKLIKESAFKLGLEKRILIDTLYVSQDVFTKRWWDDGYTITKLFNNITITTDVYSINTMSKIPLVENGCGLYELHYDKKEESLSFRKYLLRLENGIYQDLRYDLKTMNLLSYS